MSSLALYCCFGLQLLLLMQSGQEWGSVGSERVFNTHVDRRRRTHMATKRKICCSHSFRNYTPARIHLRSMYCFQATHAKLTHVSTRLDSRTWSEEDDEDVAVCLQISTSSLGLELQHVYRCAVIAMALSFFLQKLWNLFSSCSKRLQLGNSLVLTEIAVLVKSTAAQTIRHGVLHRFIRFPCSS